jgi:alpha-D-ribose 1-methylphosphonate 5-triphosphate diphosphatase
MTGEAVLKNAKIVTPTEIVEGSVHLRDGLIAELQSGPLESVKAIDFEGDYLIPGLIDLHTDNLERHMRPRNSTDWPAVAGVLAHDAEMAAVGITTILDSLYVGGRMAEGWESILESAVSAIEAAQRAGILRADHFLHLRAEISREATVECFTSVYPNPIVRLVSIMDHTPGQRQFANGGGGMGRGGRGERNRGASQQEHPAPEMTAQERREKYSVPNRARLLEILAGHTVPLASHDDTTVEHIEQSHTEGIGIAEFPTTMDAAQAAREKQMKIVAGSPNLVLGRSRSGNVAVSDLVKAGAIDVLASDYVPASLLYAIFLLADTMEVPLPKAVGYATSAPADLAGFADRGSIAPGKRADLVRVRVVEKIPVPSMVWRGGKRVC